MNIGNIVTSHPKDIANALNEFFANVGSNIANSINSLDDHRSYLRDNYPNSFFFSSVTNENVKQCIMSLKNKKCGLNDFPVKVLKQISPVIVPILTYLVNLSVTNGIFPDCLKMSRVVPLFKGGDSALMSNYRPISILNIFSKILERLVHKQLYNYLESKNVLNDSQFGFRENKSTTQALVRHTNCLYESLDDDECVFSLYLDLKKAFDSVDHGIILNKMYHYGIRGLPHGWFCSYLSYLSGSFSK